MRNEGHEGGVQEGEGRIRARRFHRAKKGNGTPAKKRMLEDRGAVSKEEGNLVREYKAMHQDLFLSSCLREDKASKAKEGEKGGKRCQDVASAEGVGHRGAESPDGVDTSEFCGGIGWLRLNAGTMWWFLLQNAKKAVAQWKRDGVRSSCVSSVTR